MLQHPILINWPVVVTPPFRNSAGYSTGKPKGVFTKEDGEKAIGEAG
ncbi:hypothetical protein RJ492_005564 [Pluralibacter gergoviae]|nr:hypothetical protein [Pluralibacter gergoviae]MBZ6861436.1 hypothetical protein [Klebsiella michiganensis]PUG80413.1 hypothetical protein DB351_25320 [Klebsiella pneumoniae]RIY02275.1 hypothetical protein D3X40_28495 [Klebsiella quasipneumoniae]TWY24985.1 hypothetical protein FR965_28295 [Serratia marcescens]HBX4004296.1 hypothetical protein [Klebsiella variicola]